MPAKTKYYKAVTKDGRIAVRSTQSRFYTRAFVWTGPKPDSNWASEGKTPVEAANKPGELCQAIEITAKEYRELKKLDGVR